MAACMHCSTGSTALQRRQPRRWRGQVMDAAREVAGQILAKRLLAVEPAKLVVRA